MENKQAGYLLAQKGHRLVARGARVGLDADHLSLAVERRDVEQVGT